MTIIVVMGVSGSGKTTIAQQLAAELGCPMLEGDSLHSTRNIQRMRAGRALTDDDRRAWLAAIAGRIEAASRDGETLVVSCSALKRRYREVLRHADPDLVLVYLTGDKELIHSRLIGRQNHFMSPVLLESQFEALEEPAADENAIRCAVTLSPRDIAAAILRQLPRSRDEHRTKP
jgi:gluconokinase